MAQFDESKVINALHVDKAEVGKKYWYADDIIELKCCVERNDNARTLISIKNQSKCFNFDINPSIYTTWNLIYPYEEPPKKSWLEENYRDEDWVTDDIDANDIRVDAIEEVCKKILDVANKMWFGDSHYEDLESIIKDLGIEI